MTRQSIVLLCLFFIFVDPSPLFILFHIFPWLIQRFSKVFSRVSRFGYSSSPCPIDDINFRFFEQKYSQHPLKICKFLPSGFEASKSELDGFAAESRRFWNRSGLGERKTRNERKMTMIKWKIRHAIFFNFKVEIFEKE